MAPLTSPSPLAEFLPPAPGAAGEASGVRVLPGELAVPGTADFAALLQDAGLAAPPLVAVEAARTAESGPAEARADARGDTGAAAPAIDGILFLAVIQQPAVDTAPIANAAETAQLAGRSRTSIGEPVADKQATVDARLATAGSVATTARDEAPPIAGNVTVPVTPAAAGAATSHADPSPAAALDAQRDVGSADRWVRPPLDRVDVASTNAQPASQRALADATKLENDSRPVSTKGIEPTSPLTPSLALNAPQPATITIETPVHDASWRLDAATRIANLVTRGIEHAEVRVTPPDLGPVELRIDVRGGEATLAIIAAQPATRDALEQALPLLRDMLAQQGLSLGQATVADGRAQSESSGNGSSPRTDAFAGNAGLEDAVAARPAHPGIARGLIDVFA